MPLKSYREDYLASNDSTELMGKRVGVRWGSEKENEVTDSYASEQAHYHGTVEGYDEDRGAHLIKYDDGDTKFHQMWLMKFYVDTSAGNDPKALITAWL